MSDTRLAEYNHVISALWSLLLGKVGVSHEDRKRRRQIWLEEEKAWELFTKVFGGDATFFYFGSQPEGSTTPGMGSDIDKVTCHDHVDLIEELSDLHPDVVTYIMVCDELTTPGYTKLQFVDMDSLKPLYHWDNKYLSVDSVGRSVLHNRAHHLYKPDDIIHGPAETVTLSDATEMDNVYCMRGQFWPQIAIPWLQRRRHQHWPSATMIERIISHGFIVVPVGDNMSFEQNLEWRISFAQGERELIFHFNDTQMHCYVTMKMIAKKFLNPCAPDCISSYVCKTCMFFMIEKTGCGFWTPENLLFCLQMCLKQVYDWVLASYCPNYFIPTRNLFAYKVQGATRVRLVQLLEKLMSDDSKFLLRIDYDDLGQTLGYICTNHRIPQSLFAKWSWNMASYFSHESLRCISVYLTSVLQMCNSGDIRFTCKVLQRLIDMYKQSTGFRKEIACVLVSVACSCMGAQILVELVSTSDHREYEHVQRSINLAHLYYLVGTSSDFTSGRLRLAAFYMKYGYLKLAEAILKVVENSYKLHVSPWSACSNVLYSLEDSTINRVIQHNMSASAMVRKQIAFSVVYMPSEMEVIPSDLIPEVFRCIGTDPSLIEHMYPNCSNWVAVDSAVYLPYLQYQCYKGLGMKRHKQVALAKLQNAVFDNDLSHEDTALNLLACCLRQEERFQEALGILDLSLSTYSPHNGAKWLIEDLLLYLET